MSGWAFQLKVVTLYQFKPYNNGGLQTSIDDVSLSEENICNYERRGNQHFKGTGVPV